MGDQKSGSTMQTSNSNSTNTSGPNPFIAGGLQGIVNPAIDWTANNLTAPSYFGPTSPAQQSARDTTWGTATAGLNGLDASFAPSVGYLGDAAGGKYLDVANDPNWQAALAASLRPQTEQFRDVLAPGIDSTFAGAGRTAGGAHFDTMMRGVNDITRNQADASAKAASDRYNAERGYQSQAAQALPGVLGSKAGLSNNWLGMLQGVGAGDTAEDRAKYSYDNTSQLDWYQRLAQSLQGMYPGGQTQGNSQSQGTGTQQQPGGGAGSILGPAMQGIGMALPFLPGFGASDRRLKTDIEELGVDPLTGLKQYAYRYKSDPKSYPKTVGPMAQDIEEVRPDLVHEIAGRKVVPMAALAPGGGGLF